jgi:bisphosphoglycerate-dependent phosphoglycerate mutase
MALKQESDSKIIKIVLVRHGESTWNQENRFTGWTDVPLAQKVRNSSLKNWKTHSNIRELMKLILLENG